MRDNRERLKDIRDAIEAIEKYAIEAKMLFYKTN
jgi:uncharacterized protein with HEPN domain